MSRFLQFALVLSALTFLTACGGKNSLSSQMESGDPAGKLVVSKTKAGGTAERKRPEPTIPVLRNTAMADHSELNPSAVPGAVNVKIASFAFELPAGAEVEVYGLASRLVGSQFSLGDAFQNLRLVDGLTGDQIGETIGTLGPIVVPFDPHGYGLSGFNFGEPIYTFKPAPWYGLSQPRRKVVVDVYADIKSSISPEAMAEVNRLGDVVVPIVVVRLRSGQIVRTWAKERMQGVYIAEHGSLETGLKPLSSNVLAAGMTSQLVLCRFSQSASAAEDMARPSFWVNISSGQSFLQQNFHWYINGLRVPSQDYTLQFDPAIGNIGTIFNNDLVFARNIETVFELRDDTVVTPEALAQNGGKWEITARLLPGTAFGVTSSVGVAVQGSDPQTHSK